MATKKITDLTELSATPASNDVVAIVDIDADVTKKITISNLQSGISSTQTLQQVITAGAQANGDVVITGSLVISGSFDAFKLETDNIILGPSANNIQAGADNSVIIGHANVQSAYSGDRNVIVGDNSAIALTSGEQNVIIGAESGVQLQAHNYNIAIGSNTLNNVRGSGNIALGFRSMQDHDGGSGYTQTNNVAIGIYSLRYGRNNSNYNVALGAYSLTGTGNTANQYNIGIGSFAGTNITSGEYNILIGPGVASDLTTQDKQLRIGSGSITTISASLATGDVTFYNTASAPNFSGSFQGDGSGLTGISGGGGNGTLIASGSVTASTDPATGFVVKASGSTLLDVQGSLGSMFSVTDSFNGNLFEVNNISGISLLNVSSSGDVDIPKGVLTVSGSVSASKFLGDGSALTGVGGDAFPFTGDAQITGSLTVSGSGGLKVTGPLEVSMTASSGVVPLSIKAASDLSTDVLIKVTDDSGGYDLLTFDSEGGFRMRADSTDSSGGGYHVTSGGVGGNKTDMGFINGTANLTIAMHASDNFSVFANGSQTSPFVGITGRGTLALGTSPSAATLPNEARTNTMFIKTGTAPSTAEADNIQFFAQDVNGVAGTASPTFLTEDSQVLQIGVTSSLSYVSASAFKDDGSQLTNLPSTDPFPFTGDAQLSGSLLVSGSINIETGSLVVNDQISSSFINIGKLQNTAIGYNADAGIVTSNIAIGYGASIYSAGVYYNNIVIGYNADIGTSNGNGNVSIGGDSDGGNNAVNVGASSIASYDDVSIGRQAGSKTGAQKINIGRESQGTGNHSITLNGYGDSVTPSEDNTFNMYLKTNQPVLTIRQTGSSLLTGSSFTVEKSGSTVFSVVGSTGTLFEVDDSLTGTIFTANDASGLPILQADSTGEVYLGKSPQSLYTTKQIASTVSTHTESIYQIDTSSLFTSAVFDYTCVSQSNATAGQIRAVWIPGTDLISFTDTALNGIGSVANIHLSVELTQSKASFLSKTDSSGWQIKTIIRSI